MVTAKDIMHTVVSVKPDDSATKARAMIRRWGNRALPVLNDDNKLVGILTRGDLLGITSSKTNILVKGIMNTNIVSAEPEEDIFSLAKKIISTGARQIPIVKGSAFLGLVTSPDIIKVFVEQDYHPVKKNISEVMKTEVVSVSPDEHISKVWDMLRTGEYNGFPVVDKGKVVGFVSRRDVFLRGGVRLSKESGRIRVSTVSKIMKQLVVIATEDKTTKEVAKLLIEKNVINIPVVDSSEHMKLVGIVDAEDILRAYTSG